MNSLTNHLKKGTGQANTYLKSGNDIFLKAMRIIRTLKGSLGILNIT